MATLAEQIRAQWPGDWNISGMDRAEELARILQSKGVTSLDGLKIGTGRQRLESPSYVMNEAGQEAPAVYANDGNYLDFGGTQIGNFGDQGKGNWQDVANSDGPNANEFGWSSAGKGAVGYSAVTGPDGRVQIVPNWNSSSDAAEVRDVALKAGAVLGGGMLANGMGLGGAGNIASSVAPVGSSELAAYGASLAPADIMGTATGLDIGGMTAGGLGGGLGGGAAGLGSLGGLDAGGYALASDAAGSMAPELLAANGVDAATLGYSGGIPGMSGSFWDTLGTIGKAAIGPAISTGLQMFAANKASNAQQDATNSANALQKYVYDTTRSDNMPALNARNSALGQMQALLKDPSSLTTQPGYQFGLNEGTKTLNNGAAARGMTYSGAQGKALQKYGQDYAGTKLDQSFNRLSALASGGQQGAGAIASANQNYGSTVGNNLTAMGDANAAKYLVNGQAVGNAVNGLTAYGQRQGWWGGN